MSTPVPHFFGTALNLECLKQMAASAMASTYYAWPTVLRLHMRRADIGILRSRTSSHHIPIHLFGDQAVFTFNGDGSYDETFHLRRFFLNLNLLFTYSPVLLLNAPSYSSNNGGKILGKDEI